MGCVNGVSNDLSMKTKIRKMLKLMSLYEEKLDQLNQRFLENLQKYVNPNDYNIDEQIIIIIENKLECETVCSQIELNNKREKTLISDYQQKVAEQNEKIQPFINQATYFIHDYENTANSMEYLILKQYIKKFKQNGFSFKIVLIQQINYKKCSKNSLDSIGTFCESVIIS
ncbi:hypothetical protein ABPG74_021067 [Tetrahymena malaccensis]